jgi:tetratricopeptide (TPR) repeat protein
MISELNREFLVCLRQPDIGRRLMQETRGWLAALSLCALIAICGDVMAADEPDYTDVNAYILQAEIALQRNDYLEAVREYRKAAELSDNPEIARQATFTGMAFGFDDEALRSAKRWFDLTGQSDEARAVVAQLSLRTGEARAAKRHFSELLEKSEEPPGEKLLMLARFLADEENAEQVDKLVRALAKPYPDSAAAHRAVATTAMSSGDYEHAEMRARKAIELDPEDIDLRLLYARTMLSAGKVDEAIDYTARLIGDDPDPNPSARVELAIMYMMAERTDDALSQLSQVMLEQPQQWDALRLMCIINFHAGNLDAASADFNDLLDTGRHDMDALHYLGRIADFREETDRAIQYYSEVTRGSNALVSQQRAAALLAHEKDDLKGAIRLLDDFAVASPQDAVEVLRIKAQVFASVDRNEDALKFYDKAIRYRPDDERIALSRAELMLRMGRLDEALDAYAEAVKRWPKSAMTLNAYGYTLADRTDRFRQAEKLIRKALKFEPDSAAIIDSMGWVLFKLGRLDEALLELERAFEKMSGEEGADEVAAHIVETLAALDRRDTALERLVAAEEQWPDSEFLADVRERLFSDTP